MRLADARLEFVAVHGEAFLHGLDMVQVQAGLSWKTALDILEERVYTDNTFPDILLPLPIDLELAQIYFYYLRERLWTSPTPASPSI